MVNRLESGNVFGTRCEGCLVPFIFTLIPVLVLVVERIEECGGRRRFAIYPYGAKGNCSALSPRVCSIRNRSIANIFNPLRVWLSELPSAHHHR